jgi:hypothetical protein
VVVGEGSTCRFIPLTLLQEGKPALPPYRLLSIFYVGMEKGQAGIGCGGGCPPFASPRWGSNIGVDLRGIPGQGPPGPPAGFGKWQGIQPGSFGCAKTAKVSFSLG